MPAQQTGSADGSIGSVLGVHDESPASGACGAPPSLPVCGVPDWSRFPQAQSRAATSTGRCMRVALSSGGPAPAHGAMRTSPRAGEAARPRCGAADAGRALLLVGVVAALREERFDLGRVDLARFVLLGGEQPVDL